MDETGKPNEASYHSRLIVFALVGCAILALVLATAFAWYFRDWSLTGFFLAVGIASAAVAVAIWPPRRK